ncbi:MAG TPA: hypothetical protein VEG60_11495 [Candidatus Binatia bacterium]|nr:hypothetical protein [Candidatus Binatia bacterium]
MANTDRSIHPLFVIAIVFGFISIAHVGAAAEEVQARENRTLEVVDHLKELIRSTERDQRSSYWLTQQLRDLVRRYDWPWRVALLHDDFRDGDYTYNPRWNVNHGDFRITRDFALRSVSDPPSQIRPVSDRRGESPAIEILQDILWGGSEKYQTEPQAFSQSPAEIYTRLPISNAFAAKVQLKFRNSPEGYNRLEFGPYQGSERDSGYRLAYYSGKIPSLTLMRSAPSRSAVVEIYDRGINLEDGNLHTIEWRRGNDGEMVVLLDNTEIIRTVDRAYADSFDGFTIINKGGVYELKEISLFGMRR